MEERRFLPSICNVNPACFVLLIMVFQYYPMIRGTAFCLNQKKEEKRKGKDGITAPRCGGGGENVYLSFSCTLFEKFKSPGSNTATDVINQIRTKSRFNLSRPKQLLGSIHRANLTPRSPTAWRRGLKPPVGVVSRGWFGMGGERLEGGVGPPAGDPQHPI